MTNPICFFLAISGWQLAGASYMDIYQSGGGIHFTVQHTRAASEEELYHSLRSRLMRMMKNGTIVVGSGSWTFESYSPLVLSTSCQTPTGTYRNCFGGGQIRLRIGCGQ